MRVGVCVFVMAGPTVYSLDVRPTAREGYHVSIDGRVCGEMAAEVYPRLPLVEKHVIIMS
jgi:hypothetical protein